MIRPLAILATALLAATQARAQSPVPAPEWRQEKCERYRAAWREALRRMPREGLGEEFIRRHEAFLARGCESPRDVCPRSKAELDLANVMIVRAMNAGTASTFPPFSCAPLDARRGPKAD